MKMEAVISLETSLNCYNTTRHTHQILFTSPLFPAKEPLLSCADAEAHSLWLPVVTVNSMWAGEFVQKLRLQNMEHVYFHQYYHL
jgi:hypothetical protein